MNDKHLSRRRFLGATGATALGFAGLQAYCTSSMTAARAAAAEASSEAAGYGPLVADPEGIFNLPKGFSYRILSREGDEMADGFRVPGNFDGMASFPGPDGSVLLVRNHELTPGDSRRGPFNQNKLLDKLDADKIYDRGSGETPAQGGTTTVVYNPRTGKIEREFLSLAGTTRNCAGGPTPWGSWISCEESVDRAEGRMEKNHGYNFEVPASAEVGIVAPVPLKAMGRFNHEAVAVDPESGIVYQTEDRGDGLIYRFIPDEPGNLVRGGKLQALVVIDSPSLDTRNWGEDGPTVSPGERMAVRWIDMDDVESPKDDLRHRGFDAGAAMFARGEGMWYGNDAIYFASTNGGKALKGQVWRYVPSAHEGDAEREAEHPGYLELFVEPNDGNLVENCDNLTVAPWGDIILAEDGVGGEAAAEQYLRGVTPDGELYTLAKNARDATELAGVNFSPDGQTLFVNLFSPGATLAITGPWRRS